MDENGGRLAVFYSILNGCENRLCQFLNLRAADDFRQVVGYIAKVLVLEHNALNLVVTENVKKYKESITDVIVVELTEAGCGAVCSEMHKLFITFRIRKNNLKRRSQLLCQFIRKMMMMMIQIPIIIEIYDLIS
jgi:hypothetical protein